MNRILFNLVSIGLYAVLLHIAGYDIGLFQQVFSQPAAEDTTSVEIRWNDWVLADAVRIPCIAQNLSGITYSRWNQMLYAVSNQPPRLYTIALSGACRREIELTGFEDTEGIAAIGRNRFVILEERRHRLSIVVIDDDTIQVDRSEALHCLPLEMVSQKNRGLEGIAFDDRVGRFYVAQEKQPRRIRSVYGWGQGQAPQQICVEGNLIPNRWLMQDISGLHFDHFSSCLLMVSDDSKCMVEMSLDGVLRGYASLRRGACGLQADIPQAEGITLDGKGDLYIVSEPNLLYRFIRRPRPSTGKFT